MGIATDLIYIIVAGLLGGFCAHLFKQPLIFGYLLAGVFVGPHTGGVTVQNIQHIEMLAEIGVALLLFALGLELSFSKFKGLLSVITVITPLQLLLSSSLGFYLLLSLGFNSIKSIWIGTAVSLSSTMFVIKTFSVRESLSGSLGRTLLAVLIAQDLAVVPMMLLLPQVTGDVLDYSSISIALLKSTVFLIGLFLAGTRVVPKLFALVAKQGSRELFLLFTLTMALGVGFISHQLGLSFALGAFVAGMLISESDFSHQALSDVTNLRDLFSLIFFVSIGMLLDPTLYLSNPVLILSISACILLIKGLITSGLFLLRRFSPTVVITAGLGLSQIGEFSFVVLKTGNISGFVSDRSFSIVIAVAVLTMLATPLLFKVATLITKRIASSREGEADFSDRSIPQLNDHVIIIGAGVVGLYVTKVLASLGKGYVTVESNHTVFESLQARGITAIYGDGSSETILRAAGIDTAKLVILATKEDAILPSIITSIRRVNRGIPIVLRVEDVDDINLSVRLNVKEIVQPQLETALEMVHQALISLGYVEAEVFSILGHLRADRYEVKGGVIKKILSKEGESSSLGRLKAATRLLNLAWVEVDEGSSYISRPIGSLGIREQYGVSIVGILRKDEFIPTPSPELTIQAGDHLGFVGSDAQIRALKGVESSQ